MNITLRRVYEHTEACLGIVSWGTKVVCSLEDTRREEKLLGRTAVPAGRYEIKLREQSPMANRYRERFGERHLGMMWLQDVPGFEWIYIHVGNEAEDTTGCVLVGTSMTPGARSISNSVQAYKLLYPDVMAALSAGERTYITIENAAS